jgi:ADP-glucose pyrophosphorylase
MELKTPQNNTLAIVMGGGAGTRLFPLTQKRAKPAVPLAAKYRLVDIPISNCLNSGFRQVYVLTQFNSESLRPLWERHRDGAGLFRSQPGFDRYGAFLQFL